jgi:hypothetical protein
VVYNVHAYFPLVHNYNNICVVNTIAAANNNKKATIKIMFLITYIYIMKENSTSKNTMFLSITQVSFFAWKRNQIWRKAFQMRWLWPEYINIYS